MLNTRRSNQVWMNGSMSIPTISRPANLHFASAVAEPLSSYLPEQLVEDEHRHDGECYSAAKKIYLLYITHLEIELAPLGRLTRM